MMYEDFDERQKSLFIEIMKDNNYKELVDFCRLWLKDSAKYDATREGLKLFMTKYDIPCGYAVPSKKALAFSVMKMLEIDTGEAKRIIEKAQEVKAGYIKVGEQGNRDVIVHKGDLANYLEACYQISEDMQ